MKNKTLMLLLISSVFFLFMACSPETDGPGHWLNGDDEHSPQPNPTDDDDDHGDDDDTGDDDDDTGDDDDDDTVSAIRINAGGPEVTINNKVFLADRLYTPSGGFGAIGESVTAQSEIAFYASMLYSGKQDERTQTLRTGLQPDSTFGYRFDLEDNQQRILRLVFVEPTAVLPDLQLFDIYINGVLVLDDLDLGAVDATQHKAALAFAVTPKKGVVEVELIPEPDSRSPVTVGSVELLAVPGHNWELPEAPRSSQLHRGIGTIALTWYASEKATLAGYRVFRDSILLTDPILPFNDYGKTTYRDRNAQPGVTYTYKVESVDVYGNACADSAKKVGAAMGFGEISVPTVEIAIDPSDQELLALNSTTRLRVEGLFAYDTEVIDAQFRYRGANHTRQFAKRSWKAYLDQGSYLGQTQVNLKSSWLDDSFLNEWFVGYLVDNVFDLMFYDVSHVAVNLNGSYSGLYVYLEDLGADFLAKRGRSTQGCLLEADKFYFQWPMNSNDVSIKNGGVECIQQLKDFTDFLNHASDAELEMYLSMRLNSHRFLEFQALNILSGNADYLMHNYYLYLDPETDLWELLPKDTDYIWQNSVNPDNGTAENPGRGGEINKLFDRAMSLPSFQYAYAKRLLFRRGDINASEVTSEMETVHDEIAAEVHADFFKPSMTGNDGFDFGIENWVNRQTTINGQAFTNKILALVPQNFLGTSLNEILPVNQSVLADDNGEYEPLIEIHNITGFPMQLNSMTLSNDPAYPDKFALPDVTIEPYGFVVLFMDGHAQQGALHLPQALSPDGGWIGLYEIKALGGKLLHELTYPEMLADQAFGLLDDKLDSAGILPEASPGQWNSGQGPVWAFPRIDQVSTLPRLPRANAPVWLVAQVRDFNDDLALVEGYARYDGGYESFGLYDDGAHSDGLAGDGVFGGLFPRVYPADAVVSYYVCATDSEGHTECAPNGAPNEYFFFMTNVPNVAINEFMADNETVFPDEAGEYEDWIELVNLESSSQFLGKFFLSDNPSQPGKWQLPATNLGARKYAVVFADNDNQGVWHAPFKLNKEGEVVLLSVLTPSGYFVLDYVEFTDQQEDTSFARRPDGIGDWDVCQTAEVTPGASNPGY